MTEEQYNEMSNYCFDNSLNCWKSEHYRTCKYKSICESAFEVSFSSDYEDLTEEEKEIIDNMEWV